MMTLELFLILLLQFEAGIRGEDRLYHRVGDDADLPCRAHVAGYPCTSVSWFYYKDSEPQAEVRDGNVDHDSARAARLRFDSKCSLLINNITAEDYGHYICRTDDGGFLDRKVYLSILNISTPDAAPIDGNVTLKCSLLRHRDLSCPEKSVRWVDETRAELPEDDVPKSNCVSFLTVKHQRGSNTRVTCQFVVENKVKIEVHYTSVTEEPKTMKIYIIIGSVVGAVLLLLLVVVVVLIKWRRTRITKDQKTTDVQNLNQHYEEIQPSLTYATVNHFNQEAACNVRENENMVTYSTVKKNMKTEADIDPSSLYSSVSNPK